MLHEMLCILPAPTPPKKEALEPKKDGVGMNSAGHRASAIKVLITIITHRTLPCVQMHPPPCHFHYQSSSRNGLTHLTGKEIEARGRKLLAQVAPWHPEQQGCRPSRGWSCTVSVLPCLSEAERVWAGRPERGGGGRSPTPQSGTRCRVSGLQSIHRAQAG